MQLTWREALGLRLAASLGGSVFLATPSPGVAAESSTLLGSGFLELSLSRPVWFGAFGISPAIGARLFSVTRDVRVNGEERLTLPLVAPQASLLAIGKIPL